MPTSLPIVTNRSTGGGSSAGGPLATAPDVELTTTSPTNIVTYTPSAKGNFWVSVYFRVITAPTVVTVTVTYTDGSGSQTYTPISAVSEAVGSYIVAPFLLNSVAADAITITVTAGTANQVYASGSVLAG